MDETYSSYPADGSSYDPRYQQYAQQYSPQDRLPYASQWPLVTPDGVAPAPAGPSGPAALRKRRIRFTIGAAAVLAAACAAAVAVSATSGAVSGTGLALQPTNQQQFVPQQNPYGNFPFPNSGNGSSPNSGSGNGNSGNGNSGSGNSGSGSSGSGSTSTGKATAAQSVGVVDIDTVLGYQGARAAGTGMVVTPGGEILTNNHVIEGATSIQVTVVSTGKTYSASVVGTDPTDDVAVIQLQNASGLATANFGDSSSVKVGDAVTGVGNAGGTGGTPSAASGHVTALDQTIQASDENGQNAETVSGLIQSDAPIQAGDSGGPLYNSAGKIIGIDTAAQTGRFNNATIAAYSIAINKALGIAQEIEAGTASSTIHIGLSGFLGVSVEDATGGGAGIVSVVTDGPAARAGIAAGDVITSVNATAIANSNALHDVMVTTKPDQKVTVKWTDQSGATHTGTVTLIAGPAD